MSSERNPKLKTQSSKLQQKSPLMRDRRVLRCYTACREPSLRRAQNTASYRLSPGCVPESMSLASSTEPKRALLNIRLYRLLRLCPQARRVVLQFTGAKSHRRNFWSAGPCSPLWASAGCRVGPRPPARSWCGHRGSPCLSTRLQLAQPHLLQKQH